MFFNNDKNKKDNLDKIAALLIHAAKIDENYSLKEEYIIEKTILEIGATKENVKDIMKKGS